MNAAAYVYVAAELRENASPFTIESCVAFLSSLPALDTPALLVADVATTVCDVLKGTPAQTHPCAHSCTQFLDMLVFCAHKNALAALCGGNPLSAGLLCCLTEAMLYCGWYPNNRQGEAKYAAHEYFSACRKMLHSSHTASNAECADALLCAAFFAQATDSTVQAKPIQRTKPVLLYTHNAQSGFAAAVRPDAPYLYTMPFNDTTLPHPVNNSGTTGKTGMQIEIHSQPLRPCCLTGADSELREKISGFRLCYDCTTDSGITAQWSIGILFFKRTVYRIDHIVFSAPHNSVTVSGNVYLEEYANLNLSIRLLDNPLGLTHNAESPGTLRRFSADSVQWDTKQPLHIVTAWASGNNGIDIDRTYLLGMYE